MDPILQEACGSLREKDGMLILAHGLGLPRLLLWSISPYLSMKESSSAAPALVFIVNADNSLIQLLREGLFAEGILPSMIPIVQIFYYLTSQSYLTKTLSSCGLEYHQ